MINDTALRIADIHLFRPEPLEYLCLIGTDNSVSTAYLVPPEGAKGLIELEVEFAKGIMKPVYCAKVPQAALVRTYKPGDIRLVLFEEKDVAQDVASLLNAMQDIYIKSERVIKGTSMWYHNLPKAALDKPSKNEGTLVTLRVLAKKAK